jgi:hypothetical protein
MKLNKWLLHGIILLVIGVIGLGPWAMVAAAGSIAEANGCELHEGFVNPCVINGVDWGERLYGWGLMGWLGIATCPLSLVALLLYLAVLGAIAMIRRRRQPV